MSKVLSIIIPAYNAEKYIAGTINSIINQLCDSSNFEILVVNDGSSDDTESKILEIIDNNLNHNIRLVTKPNGGLSDARNFGIMNALGSYLWFFDSDDIMEENCLNKILNLLKKDTFDLLGFGMREVYNSHSVETNMDNKPTDHFVDGLSYVSNYQIDYSACVFVIRRSILIDNDIFFLKGVLSEDYEFVLRLYEYCQNIKHMGEICYNYIIKDGSLSRRRNNDYYDFHHRSMIKIIDHLNISFDKQQQYYMSIVKHIARIKIIALINLINSTLSYNVKKEYYKKFKKSGILELNTSFKNGFSRKHKLIIFLVKFNLIYLLIFLKSGKN